MEDTIDEMNTAEETSVIEEETSVEETPVEISEDTQAGIDVEVKNLYQAKD